MAARRLFELVTEDGTPISPYAWRTRYALAHKKLDYAACGTGFSEIASVGPGTFKALPVLEDDGRWTGDSWAIASYLDQHYPDAPPLFSSPAELAAVRFFEKWLLVEIVTRLFRICVKDIHDRLRPDDRDYFRRSREARLKQTLEEAHAERERFVAPMREALQPMRLALREQPFIGGEAPSYADYVAIGAFIWGGAVATLPLLADDDPLLDWIRRSLRLHDGVGEGRALLGLALA